MEPDRRSEFQGFLRPEDRCAKFANMVCDDTSGAVLYMAFLAEARAADFPNAQEDSFVVHSIGIHNLACYYKTDTHKHAQARIDLILLCGNEQPRTRVLRRSSLV